jgi:hypothetical protein
MTHKEILANIGGRRSRRRSHRSSARSGTSSLAECDPEHWMLGGAYRPTEEVHAMAVFSREVRNDDSEDLATVTTDHIGGTGIVNFDMPEFGALLTTGEAERLADALLAAAAVLKSR